MDELIQLRDRTGRYRERLSKCSEGHSSFPELACVEHPPETASLLRAPEETHVARLLFWSNNAGPFRFWEPVSWHSSSAQLREASERQGASFQPVGRETLSWFKIPN